MVLQDSFELDPPSVRPDPQIGERLLDAMGCRVPDVLATFAWDTNADLIVDVARVGYLRPQWRTLDPTYGLGVFWQLWRPNHLEASDLNPAKSPTGTSVDFTKLPWPDRSFDCVVYDPPYKLNGTPEEKIDARYGVNIPERWQARMELITAGVVECARVLGGKFLLVKCQDQVASGKVRWQADIVTDAARACGLGKVDRFDFLSYRAQGSDVAQVHARHNSSSLLVFKRGWDTTR